MYACMTGTLLLSGQSPYLSLSLSLYIDEVTGTLLLSGQSPHLYIYIHTYIHTYMYDGDAALVWLVPSSIYISLSIYR